MWPLSTTKDAPCKSDGKPWFYQSRVPDDFRSSECLTSMTTRGSDSCCSSVCSLWLKQEKQLRRKFLMVVNIVVEGVGTYASIYVSVSLSIIG